MNPAAQGTKHCQRYTPRAGVRKLKEIVSWSCASVQGALAHGVLALSGTPCTGTESQIAGIANTCEASSGSIVRVGLPLRVKSPPTVPCDCERNGLRSPE